MTPNSKLTLGLVLTASAGFVDAIAFLQLGGFFASFMSGNTTQLGTAIAGQPGVQGEVLVWFPAILIVLFFSGAFLGTLIVRAYGRWGSFYVMASVVAILLLVSVLLLAAAMGAQNAAVQPIGAARLGVTYVTGTLFNAAADLACSLRGETPKWRWLQHVAVWLSLMLGAVGGGLGHSFIGLDALFVPAAMIVGVMVAYVRLN
ncbi:hypothetical protein BSVBI22_A1830 [Brucella suis VBI22]|uniref:YoaK family protein n=1 Tax=Brucella suis TaxID=29461 RepID=UPI000238930E|nr:YoaK family protein [Brucella suis]AEU06816.1 hypothetical protein BSVBI22_A1830 [Brucella suis VBI22]